MEHLYLDWKVKAQDRNKWKYLREACVPQWNDTYKMLLLLLLMMMIVVLIVMIISGSITLYHMT